MSKNFDLYQSWRNPMIHSLKAPIINTLVTDLPQGKG